MGRLSRRTRPRGRCGVPHRDVDAAHGGGREVELRLDATDKRDPLRHATCTVPKVVVEVVSGWRSCRRRCERSTSSAPSSGPAASSGLALIEVSLQELAHQFLAPSVQLPFEVALAHLLGFARTEKGFGLSEGGLGRRMGRLVGGTGLWGTVRIAQLSRHRRCAFPTSGQTPTVLSVSPARWRRRSKRPRPLVAPNATRKARPDNLVVVTTAISEASPFPRHATKTLRECPGEGRWDGSKRPGTVDQAGLAARKKARGRLSPRKAHRRDRPRAKNATSAVSPQPVSGASFHSLCASPTWDRNRSASRAN